VTTIEIALPKTSMATLTIYNLMGQVIREFNSGTLSAGYHTFVWDACNQSGARVGSGIYIYTLTAGDFTQTKKMILMR
jgi:flagellar hook assembly protein FlgD